MEELGLGGTMKLTGFNRFYEGKQVLVTGHTGFKGTWLCRMLVLAGAKVTGYALNPPTSPALCSIVGLEDMVNSVIGDVRDREHLAQVFAAVQPEIVFHLAAQPIVRDSYADPVYTYETNVMGTVNILECIRQTGSVRSFLNVTTDKVYENQEWEYGYREIDPLDGHDPYSNSKSCSELVTHSYRKSFFLDGHCAISTARAGNVIGGGDFASDRIIPDCVRAAAAQRAVLVRNPHSVRPYQHVLEPLSVYMEIAQRQYEDPALQGYYNVGPEDCDCVTTGTLAETFCCLWKDGMEWYTESMEGPHEANFLKLDCSKLRKTFGWKPKLHITEAIQMTIQWSKAYLQGEDMLQNMDSQIKEFFEER